MAKPKNKFETKALSILSILLIVVGLISAINVALTLTQSYEVAGKILEVKTVEIGIHRKSTYTEAKIEYLDKDKSQHQFTSRVNSISKIGDSIPVRVYYKNPGQAVAYKNEFPFTTSLLIIGFGIAVLIVAKYQRQQNSGLP